MSRTPTYAKTKHSTALTPRRPGKPKSKRPGRSMRMVLVLAVAMVLGGVLLVAYPYMSSYLNQLEQDKVAQVQDQVVREAAEEDLSAEMQGAVSFNERLHEGLAHVVDPFEVDSAGASNEDYAGTLNLNGDGVMGTISIPRIGVYLPVYHGTDGDFMNHGVGHVINTSLPVGGPSTHSVLAGHTGLPSAQIFDRLDQLEVGDWFVITVLGEDHAYRVYDTEVVLPDQTESLAIQDGRDLVTLVTCTPYGINTHRLLVHAERCEVPREWLDRDKTDGGVVAPSGPGSLPMWELTLMGVGAGVAAVAVAALVARRRKGPASAAAGGGAGVSGPHAARAAGAGAGRPSGRPMAHLRRPEAEGGASDGLGATARLTSERKHIANGSRGEHHAPKVSGGKHFK